jgi:thymidine kinase
MAKLYFRYSAMNSGKSTSLLQTAYNYEERGMSVLVIKPKLDTKGNDKVISRIGAERTVDYLVPKSANLAEEVRKRVTKTTACILVDEAQFLQPEQVDQLFLLTIEDAMPVIAYGLRTDFQMVGFPGATRLLELAHDLQELKTICRCGKKALLNGRKLNGVFTFEGQQVAIDGKDSVEYESLCGSCYSKAKAGTL